MNTSDTILLWFWIIGQVITTIGIIIDYALYSDTRSENEQNDINAWYGVIFMIWFVILIGATIILIGVGFGKLGLWILQSLKAPVKRLITRDDPVDLKSHSG